MAKKKKDRVFRTDAQKGQILDRIDRVKKKGGHVGQFLKAEGLHSPQIAKWRTQLGRSLKGGTSQRPTSPKRTGTKRATGAKRTTRVSTTNGGAAVVVLAQENERLRAALTEVREQLTEVAHA